MPTILKATSKGQVTIPAKWRKQYDTNQYIAIKKKNGILLSPFKINLDDIEEVDEPIHMEGDEIIFCADRDNNGEPIDVDDLIKVLKKIEQEEK